jgi:serine/threonine-protein kinase
VAGEKSRPYLVMEFLRGCTLAHLKHETRPLAEADALKIVALVCEAVGHMHDRGFVHRDLKPENIMICCDRTLRVMDLGLASPPLRHRHVLAKLAPIFGTPEYMAPEQVEHGPIDARTDIYGLGVILYELLTEGAPLHDEGSRSRGSQRTVEPANAPRALNPTLSDQAEEIVLRALQCNPEDRYPSMAAFKAGLFSLAEEGPAIQG